MLDLSELLDNRDTRYLEWIEPWPAVDADGHETHGTIIMRATVADCICMSRYSAKKGNPKIQFSDMELLDHWIVNHWCTVVGYE